MQGQTDRLAFQGRGGQHLGYGCGRPVQGLCPLRRQDQPFPPAVRQPAKRPVTAPDFGRSGRTQKSFDGLDGPAADHHGPATARARQSGKQVDQARIGHGRVPVRGERGQGAVVVQEQHAFPLSGQDRAQERIGQQCGQPRQIGHGAMLRRLSMAASNNGTSRRPSSKARKMDRKPCSSTNTYKSTRRAVSSEGRKSASPTVS